MAFLYKIILIKLSPYLYDIIPVLERLHRYPSCFQTLRCRTTLFQIFTILNEKNINSHAMFHKKLLTFIRPLENDTYGIYDPLGVRLLNRLHLGFSHLREHKF